MFNKAGRSHANGEAYKVAGKVTVHVLQELLAGIAFHSVQFGITKVISSPKKREGCEKNNRFTTQPSGDCGLKDVSL